MVQRHHHSKQAEKKKRSKRRHVLLFGSHMTKMLTHPPRDVQPELLFLLLSATDVYSVGRKFPATFYHKVVKNNRDASHLLQTCGQAHVAEMVGEERAWTVGGVPREQQPAEEGDVFTALHAAVQLCRSAQHQQLESLQQTELLFSTLKHSLTELLTLSVGGTVHRCLPLETNKVYQSLKRSKAAGYT